MQGRRDEARGLTWSLRLLPAGSVGNIHQPIEQAVGLNRLSEEGVWRELLKLPVDLGVRCPRQHGDLNLELLRANLPEDRGPQTVGEVDVQQETLLPVELRKCIRKGSRTANGEAHQPEDLFNRLAGLLLVLHHQHAAASRHDGIVANRIYKANLKELRNVTLPHLSWRRR